MQRFIFPNYSKSANNYSLSENKLQWIQFYNKQVQNTGLSQSKKNYLKSGFLDNGHCRYVYVPTRTVLILVSSA